MRCPECGDTNIKRAILQETGFVEWWNDDDLLDYEMGDVGDIVRIYSYECLSCGHRDEASAGVEEEAMIKEWEDD